MSEVRWKMYIWYKTSPILSPIYQKLLKLMEIWRSSDANSLYSLFWDTVYIPYIIDAGRCKLYWPKCVLLLILGVAYK